MLAVYLTPWIEMFFISSIVIVIFFLLVKFFHIKNDRNSIETSWATVTVAFFLLLLLLRSTLYDRFEFSLQHELSSCVEFESQNNCLQPNSNKNIQMKIKSLQLAHFCWCVYTRFDEPQSFLSLAVHTFVIWQMKGNSFVRITSVCEWVHLTF